MTRLEGVASHRFWSDTRTGGRARRSPTEAPGARGHTNLCSKSTRLARRLGRGPSRPRPKAASPEATTAATLPAASSSPGCRPDAPAPGTETGHGRDGRGPMACRARSHGRTAHTGHHHQRPSAPTQRGVPCASHRISSIPDDSSHLDPPHSDRIPEHRRNRGGIFPLARCRDAFDLKKWVRSFASFVGLAEDS